MVELEAGSGLIHPLGMIRAASRRRILRAVIVRALIIAIVALFLVAWVRAAIDVFRRSDLTPAARGAWMIGMLVVPFVGLVVYTMLRPAGASARR